MTTSLWLKKTVRKIPDDEVDVLIVGAGYVGLSTAYWLTEINPNLRIKIIDKGLIGSGASGRNAGFLTKGSAFFYHHLMQKFGKDKALEIYSFARESLNLVFSKLLSATSEIQFEQTTSMTLLKHKENFENLETFKEEVELFDFKWVEPNQISSCLNQKFFGAFESLNEFKINPIHLLQTLKKILKFRNVKIIEEMTAFQLDQNLLMTDANKIQAQHIILALNGYSGRFIKRLDNFIKPFRAQMLAVEINKSIDCSSLYYDPQDRVYWRKLGDRSILIGGKRLVDELNEQTDFDHINTKIQAALELYLKDVLKFEFNILHRWSGIMGFTQPELPIVTKLKDHSNVHLIGGFSGHGMGLGFHAGKDLAEVILNKKTKSFFHNFHGLDSI